MVRRTRTQEFLEAEKSTKESLVHEASEARVLLVEEKALLAVEREKLVEEVESRRRLEALLAAETRKEEDVVSCFVLVVCIPLQVPGVLFLYPTLFSSDFVTRKRGRSSGRVNPSKNTPFGTKTVRFCCIPLQKTPHLVERTLRAIKGQQEFRGENDLAADLFFLNMYSNSFGRNRRNKNKNELRYSFFFFPFRLGRASHKQYENNESMHTSIRKLFRSLEAAGPLRCSGANKDCVSFV